MSNWDKTHENSMWIPTRPSAARGDRYSKHKRKEKRENNDSFATLNNNNRSSTHRQNRRQYNQSSYSNPNNYTNTNYATHAYNDTKPVIIAKKKNYSSNADINDSFNSSNLDAKRQREHQRYLMQQHLNSEEVKLADYKHKQQRYSQIKNEFGLSNNKKKHTQTRIMNKAITANTQNTNKFKVLQRDNAGTKIAILDLVGNMNDDELYAELVRKAKSTPLKPVRPPIPTPHSQSLRSTPTNSVPSGTKSQSGSVPIRAITTPKTISTQQTPKTPNTATTTNTVATVTPPRKLPTVQPKPNPVDSEELEQSQRNKMRKQKETPQFKGGFVPHNEYDKVEEEEVKKIINDVRQLEFESRNSKVANDNKTRNNKNNNRNYSRYNTKDRYNNNNKNGQNYNRRENNSSSKRQYPPRRNQNSERFYRQSRSRNDEYYDNNNDEYNDYYQQKQSNEDYYGRDKNRASYSNNNNDSYNKAYRNNDSGYYNTRSNRKY